eukprot:749251-Hanusia_phi.AAC.1
MQQWGQPLGVGAEKCFGCQPFSQLLAADWRFHIPPMSPREGEQCAGGASWASLARFYNIGSERGSGQQRLRWKQR